MRQHIYGFRRVGPASLMLRGRQGRSIRQHLTGEHSSPRPHLVGAHSHVSHHRIYPEGGAVSNAVVKGVSRAIKRYTPLRFKF